MCACQCVERNQGAGHSVKNRSFFLFEEEGSMARNAEKARSMLNRWSELRKEEKFGRVYVRLLFLSVLFVSHCCAATGGLP